MGKFRRLQVHPAKKQNAPHLAGIDVLQQPYFVLGSWKIVWILENAFSKMSSTEVKNI